jgi:HEAT repeat protein
MESAPAAKSGEVAVAVQHRPQGVLLAELHHRIWEVRRDACEELAAYRNHQTVNALIPMLDDGVGAVRFSAAEALGKVGDRAATAPLIKHLHNTNFGSLVPLIESLANLKAQEAIPHMIELLKSTDVRTRGVAANALMAMTRQFIGFKAKGTEEERASAIDQWQKWWEKNCRGSTS